MPDENTRYELSIMSPTTLNSYLEYLVKEKFTQSKQLSGDNEVKNRSSNLIFAIVNFHRATMKLYEADHIFMGSPDYHKNIALQQFLN